MTTAIRRNRECMAAHDRRRGRACPEQCHAWIQIRIAYTSRTMIYPYSNATQTKWDRGAYKVQLNVPNNARPMGFCDGSEADLEELRSMSEAEGADALRIERKLLKSGREIWTLHGTQEVAP